MKNFVFDLSCYTFCFNETETSHGGTDLFVSNNVTYKLWQDLLVSEHGKLGSFSNKKSIILSTIYKHPVMKISNFNNEYLTPLLAKDLQEEKTYLLMGSFNINLLNTGTDINVSECYHILSSNYFRSLLKFLTDNIFLIQLNLIPSLVI